MAINKKWIVGMMIFLTASTFLISLNQMNQRTVERYPLYEDEESWDLQEVARNLKNWRKFNDTQKKSLSKLGRVLYLKEDAPKKPTKSSGDYKIVIWKYGPSIERRHIYHFTKKKHDPFEECSVKNCRLSYKDEDAEDADLVIIHLHRTKGVADLPPSKKRGPKQIWAFLTDESPYHTFMQSKEKLANFSGVFNWSMTYRMDADIPVPYGRTIPSTVPEYFDLIQWKNSKRSDVLLTIMGSNCASRNHRWEYVKELQKYISVDVYGRCGKLKCGGHFDTDCPLLGDYQFYLAFENSNCDDYVTEKLWWNAYHKEAIPIVMGASKDSYARLLPPHSYINVEDFASPRDLANYLFYVNNTLSEQSKYFQWKKYFTVLNEHGYFKTDSFHYCRACEALNYNSRDTKVYNNLQSYWSTKNCYDGWM